MRASMLSVSVASARTTTSVRGLGHAAPKLADRSPRDHLHRAPRTRAARLEARDAAAVSHRASSKPPAPGSVLSGSSRHLPVGRHARARNIQLALEGPSVLRFGAPMLTRSLPRMPRCARSPCCAERSRRKWHSLPPQGAIYHGIRRDRFRLMTYDEALKFRAPESVLREVNRLFDGEARRLLDARLEVQAARTAAGQHPHPDQRPLDRPSPDIDGQLVPAADVDHVDVLEAA
jgi:hypothetical protein